MLSKFDLQRKRSDSLSIVEPSLYNNQEDDVEEDLVENRHPRYVIVLNIIICIVALLGATITIIGGVRMIDAVDE